MIWKRTRVRPMFGKFAKICTSAITMGVVLYFMQTAHVVVAAVVGVAVYIICLFVFRVIDKSIFTSIIFKEPT